ncbi:exodeoxyribonuclease VII small subunit [Allocoprobacillus halotolerans]|uniref:Exodeoxyribonuclease 7 small subunit n=1 Tax=Allocoprobacillus halotolerans TaxID=2944914 RepID=A0ABY5I071_9FIRM|nr:exodeoxyribonuclease VII small subunit [Allocoprobacillus halotolerans]UTY38742.1 exodeoxyribonuclease VII small subunit [Allocoprobacillus halotolerans]
MEKMTYEQAIQRLEEIVNSLENNEIALEDSIALFQEGIALSQYCDSKLKNIQEKVAQIYEDGQLKEFKDGE